MRLGDRLCVTVSFEGVSGTRSVGFTYLTHLDDHKVGEWVIVEVPRDIKGRLVAHSGTPMVAQVTDTNPPGTMCAKANKWIIDRVHWDAYRARSALAPVIEGEK